MERWRDWDRFDWLLVVLVIGCAFALGRLVGTIEFLVKINEALK